MQAAIASKGCMIDYSQPLSKREKIAMDETNYPIWLPEVGCLKHSSCRTCQFPLDACPYHAAMRKAFPCITLLDNTERKKMRRYINNTCRLNY